MREISLKTFLYHFCKNIREDKKYCFILGSGASKPSGIPTGAELVKNWMSELTEMYESEELNQWKSEEGISEDDLAKDYSKIFDKRFELDKKEGFSFLEKIMEAKEPSCGYSVLAQIIATKNHKIVITTNFDSLTEDALFIYTQKKPLVIGHEALADYIKPFGSRPVIVKIHRDLYLTPMNTANETTKLETNFQKNLTGIFKYYTPLVIGYGGNDGSLMGFLENLPEIEGGIFWFYRETDGRPNKRIENLIEKFHGNIIPIPGFDDLMIQIGNKLELERLDEKIVKIAELRAKNYREQIEKVTEQKATSKETKEAVSNMVSRGKKDWWYYELAASQEEDLNKREKIYEEGFKNLPRSAELYTGYAIFLSSVRKDYNRAEESYKKAIELNPENAHCADEYAIFLADIRNDYDMAEKWFRKAIELAPTEDIIIGNYAFFLKKFRKNYDTAEQYYKRALELNPQNPDITANYAFFLSDIRKNYDMADIYYRKVLELNPQNPNINANYAIFLSDIRKEYDIAEEYYEKSIKLDPNNADFVGNYAKLLIAKRKLKEADDFIKKAFELNQKKKETLDIELWFYRYAVFFDEYKEAEKNIEQLLEKGISSPGWYLDDVLVVAKELNHPDYEKLCDYAKRISAIE